MTRFKNIRYGHDFRGKTIFHMGFSHTFTNKHAMNTDSDSHTNTHIHSLTHLYNILFMFPFDDLWRPLHTIYMWACVWMKADVSSLTWPGSHWLDSVAGWGCTPVHWIISVHRLNQPSPHVLTESSCMGTWSARACIIIWKTYNKPASTQPPCVLVWRNPVKGI